MSAIRLLPSSVIRLIKKATESALPESIAEKVNQYYVLIEAGAWDSFYSSSTTESTESEVDSELSREMSATPTENLNTEPIEDNTTDQAANPVGETSKPTSPGFIPFSLNYQRKSMYENKWKDDGASQD